MTMYPLEMRRLAEEQALNILRQSHGWLQEWITTLKNMSLAFWTTQPYGDGQANTLTGWRASMLEKRNKLQDWRNGYAKDIEARLGSDYVEALDGAITSYTNLMNHMKTLAQSNYWDSTANEVKPSEVSQTDRNALAADFEDELPAAVSLACAPSFALTITADLTVS